MMKSSLRVEGAIDGAPYDSTPNVKSGVPYRYYLLSIEPRPISPLPAARHFPSGVKPRMLAAFVIAVVYPPAYRVHGDFATLP
jgi:hypothetical protein